MCHTAADVPSVVLKEKWKKQRVNCILRGTESTGTDGGIGDMMAGITGRAINCDVLLVRTYAPGSYLGRAAVRWRTFFARIPLSAPCDEVNVRLHSTSFLLVFVCRTLSRHKRNKLCGLRFAEGDKNGSVSPVVSSIMSGVRSFRRRGNAFPVRLAIG